MAAIYGIYAHMLGNVHPSFRISVKNEDASPYLEKSILNYVATGLKTLAHRGSDSMKITISDNVYFSDTELKKSEILGLVRRNGMQATGQVSKLDKYRLSGTESKTSIDGFLVDKKWGSSKCTGFGSSHGVFREFDRKFSHSVESGDMYGAMSVAEAHMNGALVRELKDGIVGIRTGSGYKPLFIIHAQDDENDLTMFSSEDFLANRFRHAEMKVESVPVKEGQMVIIDKDGVKKYDAEETVMPRYDPHEPLYMMHPDSTWNGKSVYNLRKSVGAGLADLYSDLLSSAELVTEIPYDPKTIALGMSNRSGVAYDESLIKLDRSVAAPQRNYSLRNEESRFLPIEEVVKGKNVVLVDDSVITGKHIRNVRELLTGKAKSLSFVSAEVPIVEEMQVGAYSESWRLIARDCMMSDFDSISDFNKMVSQWTGSQIYFNTPENLSNSLGTMLEDLYFPPGMSSMNLS
jgi:glutamine phosphoribosylpyrophosphate amidotransferase